MRIVAGKHRGRRLQAPAGRDTRPTTDRTRESIFNILAHSGWGADGGSPVEGAVVLDVFCGTGALGLEALSRGAERALFFDLGRAALDTVRANIAELGEGGRTAVLRADATKPPAAREAASLVFLDPPYGQDLAPKTLAALVRAGWLAPGAVAVVEEAAGAAIVPPDGFAELEDRRYGDTRVLFLMYEG
ncbi:16S rRNA (guanine(966)-N(2))-methyltransferase RsmD [Azospirillum sp. sgz301742]